MKNYYTVFLFNNHAFKFIQKNSGHYDTYSGRISETSGEIFETKFSLNIYSDVFNFRYTTVFHNLVLFHNLIRNFWLKKNEWTMEKTSKYYHSVITKVV